MGRRKKEMVNVEETKKIEEIKEKDKFHCCICGNITYGYGNDPYPIKNTGRCCDQCNQLVVLRRLGPGMRKPISEVDIEE